MSDDPATEVKALPRDPIVTGILDRLSRELDASLFYHRPAHTEDVIQQALTLAELDALDAHSMLLIAVASSCIVCAEASSRLRISTNSS